MWVITNRKPKERRGKVQLINATRFFQKMRRSLGNKRNEIGDGRQEKPDHIADITRIYCDFQHDPHCIILDNSDLGYRQITIERPLRLAFQSLPERIERLREATTFRNLAKSKKKDQKRAAAEEAAGRNHQEAIIAALRTIDATTVFKDRDQFLTVLEAAFRSSTIRLLAPLRKAILAALSERDDTAAVCCDAQGNPEPDPQLRDYENVPLKESVEDYFSREVSPHVPDAWINNTMLDGGDGRIGQVGYNIPLTRYFYAYRPPANLDELESTVRDMVTQIAKVFGEVTT